MSIILVSRVPLQSNMTIKHQLQHLAAAAHMVRDWNHTFTYINGEWSVRSKLIGSQFHLPFKNSFFKHADTMIHVLCQIRFHNVKSISSKFTSFVFTERNNIKNRLQKLFLANWLVKRLILLLDNGVISCKACFQVVWQLSPLFL